MVGGGRLRRARERQLDHSRSCSAAPPSRSSAGGRALQSRGHQGIRLPVSHAFHTEIVAPAAEPLRQMLRRLDVSPPRIPVVANVDGEFYPAGPGAEERMIEILGRQVASRCSSSRACGPCSTPGARVFVETGPKRACTASPPTCSATTRRSPVHEPPQERGPAVVQPGALRPLRVGAHGFRGAGEPPAASQRSRPRRPPRTGPAPRPDRRTPFRPADGRRRRHLRCGWGGCSPTSWSAAATCSGAAGRRREGGTEPVVITGAALGLPGTERPLRRRQPRAHPARRAAHRRDPLGPAPRDPRQARHPPGQGRRRTRPPSRRSTTPTT